MNPGSIFSWGWTCEWRCLRAAHLAPTIWPRSVRGTLFCVRPLEGLGQRYLHVYLLISGTNKHCVCIATSLAFPRGKSSVFDYNFSKEASLSGFALAQIWSRYFFYAHHISFIQDQDLLTTLAKMKSVRTSGVRLLVLLAITLVGECHHSYNSLLHCILHVWKVVGRDCGCIHRQHPSPSHCQRQTRIAVASLDDSRGAICSFLWDCCLVSFPIRVMLDCQCGPTVEPQPCFCHRCSRARRDRKRCDSKPQQEDAAVWLQRGEFQLLCVSDTVSSARVGQNCWQIVMAVVA